MKGLLVYFSPFFLAILVHRAYGPKKPENCLIFGVHRPYGPNSPKMECIGIRILPPGRKCLWPKNKDLMTCFSMMLLIYSLSRDIQLIPAILFMDTPIHHGPIQKVEEKRIIQEVQPNRPNSRETGWKLVISLVSHYFPTSQACWAADVPTSRI